MGRSLTPVEIGVSRLDKKVYLQFWLLSVYEAGSGKVSSLPVVHSIEVECAQESGQFVVSGLLFNKWYYDDDELVEEYGSEDLSSLEDNTEVEPYEVAQRIFEHLQGR